MPPSTLSTHFGILQHARLVKSERQGRTILYRADLKGVISSRPFAVDLLKKMSYPITGLRSKSGERH